jgi:hypothetical protein
MALQEQAKSESLYEQNRRNFFDAVSFKPVTKIPVGVIFAGWPLYYGGVRFDELITTHQLDKLADSYLKFFREVGVDYEWASGLPPSAELHKALGDVTYDYGEDGIAVNHLQVYEDMLGPDIYDKIIDDYDGFQKSLRDRAKVFQLPTKEASYAAFKNAVIAGKEHNYVNGKISQGLRELGVYSLIGDMALNGCSGFMQIFSMYRGIKNTLIDLRRMPEKVIEASNVIFNSRPAPSADENPKKECIVLAAYHAEGGFLNEEMFDKLFFNNLLKVALPYTEQGAKILAGIEGRFINTLDRYRAFPKGSVVIILDQDDPFEVHKKMGDHSAIATGVPAGLLAVGTKQQCTDYIKRAFDTFAPGGGFVFMPSVMLNSSKDAKIENMVASFELAHELSRQV